MLKSLLRTRALSESNAGRRIDPTFGIACTLARVSLDGRVKSSYSSGIAQRTVQPIHGSTYAVFEFDNGSVGPKTLANFLPRDHDSRLREQHNENLEWLFWKTDCPAGIVTKLGRAKVEAAKPFETNHTR